MRGSPDIGKRLLVAYFSSSDAAQVQALNKKLRRRLDSARILTKRGTAQELSAQLQLEDEILLDVWVATEDLAEAVQFVQFSGARAVFIFAASATDQLEEARCVLTSKPTTWSALRPIVDDLERQLLDSSEYLRESLKIGHPASPAAQWIIDNSYIAEFALSALKQELKRAYKHLTPKEVSELWLLATRYMTTESRGVDEEELRDFLEREQTSLILSSPQLWNFPLFLKFLLVESVVVLACHNRRTQHLRELAFFWANRSSESAKRGKKHVERVGTRLNSQPFATDATFLVALAEQLQDQETTLRGWPGPDIHHSLPEKMRDEHAREAAEGKKAADYFSSLKSLPKLNFRDVFDAVSRLERLLSSDPAGVYSRSAFETRDFARQRVVRLARQSGRTEIEIAQLALDLAASAEGPIQNQVLYYLVSDGAWELERKIGAKLGARRRIRRSIRKHSFASYSVSILLLTLFITAAVVFVANQAGLSHPFGLLVFGVLTLFPISELATQLVQTLIVSIFPPLPSPKLDFRQGIPDEARTLVVVPMMMATEQGLQESFEKLEVRFLANREQNLSFALLADFTDHSAARASTDSQLIQTARNQIEALEAKYGRTQFAFLYRQRAWSNSESAWIGKERKRGKIEALNQLLCGELSELLQIGALPQNIRYVITVDADTKLPPRVAMRLVEAIAHPLHRVELDPHTGARKSGYAIFQPRVSIALPGAVATRFTKIFADAQGSDPYCTVVSDAQQDLFGEGIFHGKAIYDVQALNAILKNRFPAETILSHDLIEGAHAGVRYSSDIELLEDVPSDYAAFSARQHRWTRGDWQIWPWILPSVPSDPQSGHASANNPLNAINRWRVADNLRRSLTAPATVLLLLLGWAFSRVEEVWTLTIALAVVIPALVPLLERWSRHVDGTVYGWRGATEDIKRAVILLAVLPHQAWLSVDALVRALYRLHQSRRHLLEWLTAEHAGQSASTLRSRTMRQLLVIAGISALLLIGLGLKGDLRSAAPLLLLWIAAPFLVHWLAQPVTQLERRRLDASDESELRQLARLTWRFFDDLVNQESSWLPPDNTQLQLRVEVAQRTSPTNIGLWLNSAVAATDLGFLTTAEFVARTSRTFETLHRLERYEGHFLNWYDTRSATPLEPKYVSTVDSGNLIASLWHFGQACIDLKSQPIVSTSCFRGLADVVSLIADEYRDDPALKFALQGIRESLGETDRCGEAIRKLRVLQFHAASLKESTRWPASPQDNLGYWIEKLSREVDNWNKEVDSYLRWVDVLMRPSDESLKYFGQDFLNARIRLLESAISLEVLAESSSPEMNFILSQDSAAADPEWKSWLSLLRSEFGAASARAAATLKQLNLLGEQSEFFARSVNMNFLYDSQRRLFGIGYTVGHPRVFQSHYDLLASECRLASLVAIAKGDVPLEHWFVLSRPWINSSKRQALLSWSGTMFEYLMPALFLEPYENSLLSEACNRAVDAQIEYSHPAQNVWGISESAYGALDANGTYQYRAFGVPALALNPAVDPGPVISPYSSVLALMIRPVDALQNIRRLKGAGLMGGSGLYEAIDYTRSAKRDARPGIVIYTYMAHHQAMSLLALSNVIGGEPLQRKRFHRDPRVRSVESLLFEKIPIAAVPAPDPKAIPVAATRLSGDDRHWAVPPSSPKTFFTSNGLYTLMLSSNGSGYGQWKNFAVNRWRADATLDDWGHLIWIRDVRTGKRLLVSHPFRSNAASRLVTFSPERAEYLTKEEDLECKLEVVVASDFDGEVRRLTVSNRSLRTKTFELTSYLELALAPQTADATHQAFSKLFVETQYVEDGVLLAHRRRRSPEDEDLWVLYVVAGGYRNIRHETDRRAFLGRNREVFQALGLQSFPSGSFGSVLDPVFASQFVFSIEGREQKQIAITIAAHSSREALLELLPRLKEEAAAKRELELAWFRSQLQFRHLRIEASASHRFQDLASLLVFPSAVMHSSESTPPLSGQRHLWKFGISGDLPIVLTSIDGNGGLPLLRELLLAKAYLRIRGLELDLVVLSTGESGYETPLRKSITRLIHAHSADLQTSGAGKVFQLTDSDLTADELKFLHWAAPVVFPDHQGPLQRQLLRAVPVLPAPLETPFAEIVPAPLSRPIDSQEKLALFNGLGGFSKEGEEYVIQVGPDQCPPTPWANVIANPNFGLLLTEAGIGPVWSGNSQMNRLTPWRNDPVSDRIAECLYIRDESTGKYWSATPSPSLTRPHARIRHGHGYSIYEMSVEDVRSSLTIFCAPDDRFKYAVLNLQNTGTRSLDLSVTHFAEWVLGSLREQQQSKLRATYSPEEQVVVVRQHWNEAFAADLAFVCCDQPISWHTLDRGNFLGPNASHARPRAMGQRRPAMGSSSPNDICSALRCNLTLEPGASAPVIFAMGVARDSADLAELRAKCNLSSALASFREVRERWNRQLGTLQIKTPEASIDFMVNRWLLYQSLSCRFWGRTALYQSGGALGFRDQLQDCLAFLYSSPALTRTHLLVAASSQFPEGDVMHWWHPISGLGVRTRCSDDMLWLPWVLSRYLDVTQDFSILSEQAPFVDGPPLAEGEHERMFTFSRSGHQATLLDHALLALRYAARVGPHGIPLMGNGDWNDGMNRIGPEGRGESIWMSWFFCDTVRRWKPYSNWLPDSDWRFLQDSATSIARQTEEFGWNGQWYLRAFFDDGTPLGLPTAEEAQIDSLPQSWAILSQAADKQRAADALSQAMQRLFHPKLGVMNLFTPAFDKSTPHPGYIMGYPPGVRENGGQYTHGALWTAQALAQSGRSEDAVNVLQISNPAERTRTPEGLRQYWGDPYAVAADISSSPGREGRAGWTWYTGSAGWMYRIWIEDVLGFKLQGSSVRFAPSLPDAWPECRLDYRFGSALYRFHLTKDASSFDPSRHAFLSVDPASPALQLVDDGKTHEVVVALFAGDFHSQLAAQEAIQR